LPFFDYASKEVKISCELFEKTSTVFELTFAFKLSHLSNLKILRYEPYGSHLQTVWATTINVKHQIHKRVFT